MTKRNTFLSISIALGLTTLLMALLFSTATPPVSAGSCPTDLFISEYIEGSSNNKAIEIYNGTGSDINMTGYSVILYTNGSTTPQATLNLSGLLSTGEVYVIAHSEAVQAIQDEADINSAVTHFNGNDALVLAKDSSVIDSLGEIGNTATWGEEVTLVRKSNITAGDTIADDAFDPTTEWDSYAQNTFTYLGSHTMDSCAATSLSISKSAPSRVAPGTLFTYTLTARNHTSATLNNLLITDTVPTSTTFAYALDSGVENNDVVSWTIASLAPTQSLTVQFAVTATTAEEVYIRNDDYVASATGITPTHGAAVQTAVSSGTSIHHIQGSGAASPLDGQTVEDIEGVVTAIYAEGFYMQEPNADADPQTSEGIYVYTGSAPTVSVGDLAEVDGEVDEYYNLTELINVTVSTLSSGHTITATAVTLPLVQADDYEAYEGMLVTFPQKLTVNDVYDLGRYGSATLAQGGRLFNPTNVITPGTPANDLQAANDLRTLVLDDGSSVQNPDPIPYPSPELSATNTLRSGYAITDITGILSYNHDEYKLYPTSDPHFVHENARTTTLEAVGGTLTVASFNVLNYFNGDGVGGGFPTARGADTSEEFDRQHAKIVKAILDIDADVVGLMEIENDGYNANSAIADLVAGLNAIAGAGTYAYIDPGVTQIGTDQIAVGLIYQPGSVTPVGTTAILDSTFDPNYRDTKNRPALTQSFEENATGERFTAVVNHLKSKGSDCDALGDPDTGDGQGNCNLTRTAAAEVMLDWIATDPTGINDTDYLILGDLNAYALEDPVMALQDGGFTNLLSSYAGAEAYSYVYYGQAGYLDHALANPTLLPQITGATIWHINADEPRVLDYNMEYKTAGQLISLYNVDPYRASDHDPVVIGLELRPLILEKSVLPATNVELGEIVTYTLTFSNTSGVIATNVQLTDTLPLSVTFGGFVTANGATETGGEVTWIGTVTDTTPIIFTTTVNNEESLYGATITNEARYTYDSKSYTARDAGFTVIDDPEYKIYLPLVLHNHSG